MPDYGVPLNTGTGGIHTSAESGDDGGGVTRWHHWIRSKVMGESADAAITNPATDTTMIAALKGLLTLLAKSATGLMKAIDDPAGATDYGVVPLYKRVTTVAAVTPANGDWVHGQVDDNGRLRTIDGRISSYPAGATPKTAASGNVANAAAVATLAAGGAGTTNYITGFTVTASGATAGLPVTVTVANVITGTLSYTFVFPAGVLVPAEPLVIDFAHPIPANATNTTIVVTCPAGGAGNTNATVTARGFHI